MNKLPYIPLFAADWLAGTRHLSRTARDAYMTLLCYQWLDGPLPADPVKLGRLVGLKGIALTNTWAELEGHFERTIDGWVNRRLEDERVKSEHIASRKSEGGKTRAREMWKNHRSAIAVVQESNKDTDSTSSSSSSKDNSVLLRSTGDERREEKSEQPWNNVAAEKIRAICYHGTKPDHIASDLRWWREKLDDGDSPERITFALYGLKVVAPGMVQKPWSPARVFGKHGPWPDLYERAITADGKSHRIRGIGEVMRKLAQP